MVAIDSVRANPQFREIRIVTRQSGNVEGWFDHRKLERAFFNLLLNACEAVGPREGRITIALSEIQDAVEIKFADNGHGIPDAVRTTLFDPFVSQGKENGTGLGLTTKLFRTTAAKLRSNTPPVKGQPSAWYCRARRRLPLPVSREQAKNQSQQLRLA